MSITQLREPLKSYFAKLEAFRFGVTSDGKNVSVGMWSFHGLPDLDPEDAHELANELNKAVLPVIAKFTARKLEQFLKSAGTATASKDSVCPSIT